MAEILKREGKPEEFNREKIHKSVMNAGVPEPTAREIATKIDPATVKTTNEIRRHVAEELRKKDPTVAQRYEHTRNLAARKAVEAAMGTVKLSNDMMRALGANPGDNLVVEHHGKTHTLKAEMAPIDRKEMHLNEGDLQKLGVPEGTRLAVRRAH